MVTYSEARSNLWALINKVSSYTDLNEAQTRFHIIDEILKKCLDWEDEIEVEYNLEGGFADYHLGSPKSVVLEAKRQERLFDLPAGYKIKRKVDIPSLMSYCKETDEAIRQVQEYCALGGISIAVISNGSQFIAFLGSRTDSEPVLKGSAVVFHDLNDLYEDFQLAWDILSKPGVKERNIVRFLKSKVVGIPKKLNQNLLNYPKARYANDLQTNLRNLSQIFLQDMIENEYNEPSFIKECYCESGELEQFSLLSRELLQKRYSSLFSESENSPTVLPVNNKKKANLTQETVADSISRRPIVLLGDVGVGKTSFLKNLMYNTANNEFKDAISVYINLGTDASLTSNLKEFVLNEIENQLLQKYDIGVMDAGLIHGIYASEINTFNRSFKGALKQSNPSKYEEELINFLTDLTKQKDQHFKKLIEHYTKNTKKQFIVIIDNADQRNYEVQQEAFIISQELAKNWRALVFIAVRPNTFYRSQRAGTFSAYPHRIFTIQPPRIDKILEKRLSYVLSIARGEIPIENNATLNAENLALFLRALLKSLKNNKEIYEFLSNITGGNIRQSIELVVNFIGSPNVDCQKIIDLMIKDGYYHIPLHEFTKSALLGDFAHFHPNNSVALNLFDVFYPKAEEHFLKPLLLAYINSDTTLKDANLFYEIRHIYDELQTLGYGIESINDSLRVLTNKKLIETSQRITFEEDADGNILGEMPDKFRITSIGLYHLQKWMGTFTYLDAMVYDTPIFEESVLNELNKDLESFDILHRYDRSLKFKEYLLSIWNSKNIEVNYFDFSSILKNESQTFENVKVFVEKKKMHLDN